MRLAIVVPAYNERALLPRMIERIDALPPLVLASSDGRAIPVERILVVVDDGSTDGTAELVAALATRKDVVALSLPQNRGKGAALRRGFAVAREMQADAVIVQDADLEYHPSDHAALVQPIADGRADFVIGTRFFGMTRRAHLFWHSVGNRALTGLANMLSNIALSDMECGLKCLSRAVLERLELEENRFGVEPEIVAKVARMRLPAEGGASRSARIYEVSVNYDGRSYAEGKKITWVDAVSAVRCILKYNLRH